MKFNSKTSTAFFILGFVLFANLGYADSVSVSGRCFPSTIDLGLDTNIGGKNIYFSRLVNGPGDTSDVSIVFSNSNNRWEILLDGQPFFFAPNNSNIAPPGTPPSWTAIDVDGDMNANNDCPGTDLSVSGDVALPVELISFKAVAAKKSIALNWKVGSERNLSGYELQRRSPLNTWEKIAFITAENKSDYYYTDNNPTLMGANYYRLKRIDNDGTFEFSDVVSVNMNQPSIAKPTLFPNPTEDKLNISFNNYANMTVSVVDTKGKIWISKVLKNNDIIDFSELNSGAYVVYMNSGFETWTERIVKK